VGSAKSEQLDALFSSVVAVALQRENLAEDDQDMPVWKGWQASNVHSAQCEYVLESNHPYLPAMDYYETVSFPGADYIMVYFDPRSATEADADWVTFYKDETYTTFWGPPSDKRLSGPASKGWPGSNGRAPLVIPADRFCFHFHSDASVEEWGYKIRFVAPVNNDAARALQFEEKNENGASFPWRVCLQAVAKSLNSLALARTYLRQNQAILMAEDKAEVRHYLLNFILLLLIFFFFEMACVQSVLCPILQSFEHLRECP
jgi:hypothetical protein